MNVVRQKTQVSTPDSSEAKQLHPENPEQESLPLSWTYPGPGKQLAQCLDNWIGSILLICRGCFLWGLYEQFRFGQEYEEPQVREVLTLVSEGRC